MRYKSPQVKAFLSFFFWLMIFFLAPYASGAVNLFEIFFETNIYKNGKLKDTCNSGDLTLLDGNYGKAIFETYEGGHCSIRIFGGHETLPWMLDKKYSRSKNIPSSKLEFTLKPELTDEGLINLKGVLGRYDFLMLDQDGTPTFKFSIKELDLFFDENEIKEFTLYDDGKGTKYVVKLKSRLSDESRELKECSVINLKYDLKGTKSNSLSCDVNMNLCPVPGLGEEVFSFSCSTPGFDNGDRGSKEARFSFEGTIASNSITEKKIRVKLELKRELEYSDVIKTYEIVKEFEIIKDQKIEIELPSLPHDFPIEVKEKLKITYFGQKTKK